jgi:glycosyltransferase involved in cell wall biosynthesis
MKRRQKLHWLAWQPTPYNDVLFRALANDPEVDFTVHYRFSVFASHPWQTALAQGYKNRFYQDGRSSLCVDYQLVRRVIKEKDSIFVLAGWPGLTVKFVLFLLVLLRRQFLFWNDTPHVIFEKKGTSKPKLIEISKYQKPYTLWPTLMRRIFYWLVFTYAKAVMSTGKPGVKTMVDLGCSDRKVINLPYFTDLLPIDNNGRLSHFSQEHPFTFVSSGRLVKLKGYDLAIKALAIIKKEINIPFRYILVGDGPERKNLEKLALTNGLKKEVEFWAWQEPSAVKNILRNSHAFIHPSRWDPYAVAVLEAMVASLPVLGSDATNAVLDRVEHGVNGFIHPKEDLNALVLHMMTLLKNPKLTMRMGRAARQTAEEWPVSRGVEIIKNIIDKRL